MVELVGYCRIPSGEFRLVCFGVPTGERFLKTVSPKRSETNGTRTENTGSNQADFSKPNHDHPRF